MAFGTCAGCREMLWLNEEYKRYSQFGKCSKCNYEFYYCENSKECFMLHILNCNMPKRSAA
ncbi:hypothetical protein LCGC14_1877670 [marine sediment metagenome]|uniref:Uncharacterized protein n=1 Tax=marine sediment metagenome TaxID=412755 RepID=A0A0F9IH86_9ZZZZ